MIRLVYSIVVFGVCFSVCLGGCTKPRSSESAKSKTAQSTSIQAEKTKEDPPPIPKGTLVFEDDFERESLGEKYQTDSSQWRIQEGRLHVNGDRNQGFWLKQKLPVDYRVDFTARSTSPEGDIKVEISAQTPEHQGGYVIILGGWKNTISVIARLDEHGADRLETRHALVTRNKEHQFSLVRQGESLRWYLDGALVLEYEDKVPLKGGHFGFANWESPVSFDGLRVYSL